MILPLRSLLAKLAAGGELDRGEADALVAAFLDAEATPVQIASAVTAIQLRGETVTEIVAFARALRAVAETFDPGQEVLDTCGTGGDGAQTLNISTAAAIVAAASGVRIAKHGGRAVSSRSGSADVLAVLGVRTDGGADVARAQLAAAGVCFLSAARFHPTMARVAPIRAELGFRTIFNLIGPLANPAGARRQLVGVYAPEKVGPMARVLGELGAERAWVVHGDGLDELTLSGPSLVAEWRAGAVRAFSVAPEDVDLSRAPVQDLRGGDAQHNARALRALLEGAQGPYRDIVVLNTAAVLVIAERQTDLRDAAKTAAAAIDSGAARRTLDRLAATSEAA